MDTKELWEQYRKHKDPGTKTRLIETYVELVKIIAGRLYATYGNHLEFDDLVSYGIFGLIDAIEKFDPGKNVKFETYAQIRIRGAVVDQIRNLDWIPRSVRQKSKQIEEVISKLENQYQGQISDAMIAEALDMSVQEFQSVLQQTSTFNMISLEEKLMDSAEEIKAVESHQELPEQMLMKSETSKLLMESIQLLPDRERQVISLYYYEELTYKEIGNIMGVSESRISQLHSKAVTRIRNRMEG
ncbi:FliA/WhiG family RNA polymerase sigma factor [Anoxynatronum buryatiense]|uniref:RNA polymerase sigma factor n=1 Tax=Anoxynatronum buryatiense TaxID=489973 RepID=A0AA46AIC4_9CLOT|nr:FliA/WhiG family RNA polymerase sigma factor [Anoxynatronum buryatiense]SMP47449.1 RNA polymerase, sigma 28 subunit, SigD/FliA/WhiG [Anoxynatronum buryatiense]